MALAASTAPAGYTQHRPERTLLYQIVAEHLETFLDEASSAYARGLPKYVERELRAYLACGIQAHGFLRARCRQCGKNLLVAFSCKMRGVCPSCNARRMCGTAAHLVDHVFPGVPVRQWVLSVPFELRLLLAKNHRALSAVGRMFVRESSTGSASRRLCVASRAPAVAPSVFRSASAEASTSMFTIMSPSPAQPSGTTIVGH